MTCTKCAGTGKIDGYQRSSRSAYTLQCGRCAGLGTVPIFYAGIGSHETPEPVCLEMGNIAMQLAIRGFALRSGGADGADVAFEKGAKMVGGPHVIRGRTHWQPALDHAAQFHPDWEACDDTARALHARNSMIMLGDQLDLPVAFVVCWTPGGAVIGGTGQALRIAPAYNIPVFNLAVTPAAALWSWLNG
jgi:hypothetical protein